MTAMNPATAARIGSRANPESAHGEAHAARRLWTAVVLATLSDYWTAAGRAGQDATRIRAEALRYFRSRDGREVASLAGLTVDPERIADMAVSLDARNRTVRGDA